MTSGPAIARNRDEILKRLRETPLRTGQLDVNGRCNAKCWYCPVKYEGNPEAFDVQMALEELDHILGNLRASPLIPKEFWFLYTCHYNEVLLYPQLEELLGIFRKHRLCTSVLSNGTPLSPKKTDLILANSDVVRGICLNIPALEPEDWSRKAGFPVALHKGLMRNLDYLHEKGKAHIQVNCDTTANGQLDKSMGATPEQAQSIQAAFKARFPNFTVGLNQRLSDRAGRLESLGVLARHKPIETRVIGCSHSGSRIFEWLHITPKGDLFLCCDDYEMEYRFGNLLQDSFEKIWLSDAHVDAIARAFSDICTGCWARVDEQVAAIPA
jgi:radical SAM protein with 4Fe4S-binding SPASM domain